MPSITLYTTGVLLTETSSITGLSVEDETMFGAVEAVGSGVSGYAAGDVVVFNPGDAKARFREGGVIYYVLDSSALILTEVPLP